MTRQNPVVTVNSIITIIFTAIFMPWALWLSSQMVQTRVDVAIIKLKLHVSKSDYESYFKNYGPGVQFAIPSLLAPPLLEEKKE